MRRIYLAFLCFFRVLFGKPLPKELVPTPPLLPAPEPDPTSGALQLLGMFQREGRLVDFICEPIDGYGDDAIGAAARDIHRGLRKVFTEHFLVEPILNGEENQVVNIGSDFDPARVRLVGKLDGKPPFRGTLRHHGWQAVKTSLPKTNLDPRVVAPAEVELS